MAKPPRAKPSRAAGPVWSKRVDPEGIGALNVSYCAGRDVRPRPEADRALVAHDLATNAAHAVMLGETGIVEPAAQRGILSALIEARRAHAAGEELLRPEAEDIHMSLELFVTEHAGDGMGGRLHTGRSRNDQVATDMRLWLREEIAALGTQCAALAESLAQHALKHAKTPCPGLTHMQPGMVTTWGHWTASYLARVERSLGALRELLGALAECPLGGAASYGTSWPLDRARTATLLGFERPTPNSVDAIQSRGELEARFAFVCTQLLNALSGMGQDLILLSSPPRDWVRLDDAFVTGSSIMPQKRNPDFAEVTRAKAATVAGQLQALLAIGVAAPGGYNRDTQWTKYLAMDVAEEARNAPLVFSGVFETLSVNADAMRSACAEGFLNATDVADHLARTRGLPFRTCYRVLGAAVKACEKEGRLTRDAINAQLAALDPPAKELGAKEMAAFDDPLQLVMQRTQPGSPHPERVRESVEALRQRAADHASAIEKARKKWTAAVKALWAHAEKVARGK